MIERDIVPIELPEVRFAGREVAGEDYFWDNSTRKNEEGFVIQQTLSGMGYIEDQTRRWEVPKGHAMLFVHGEPTMYGQIGGGRDAYVLNFVVLSGNGGVSGMFLEIQNKFGRVIAMDSDGEAAVMLNELVESFVHQQFDRITYAEMGYRLLLSIYREQISGVQSHDPVAYGRHLLMNRFRRLINLKELVDELGISREHFSRVFKKRYNETPAEYLRTLRLNHARSLIRTTRMAIEDIAPACGFSHPQTLRRAYREYFGKTVGAERSYLI